MKVVVTGGLGANGAFVVRSLLERGVEPVVLDLPRPTEVKPNIPEGVMVEHVDICDEEETMRTLGRHKPTCIIHLAAVLTQGAVSNPQTALAVNVGGTTSIVRAAAKAGSDRVVLASSKAVYGAMRCKHGNPEFEALDEGHGLHPEKFYDYTKVAAEGIVRHVGSELGVESVWLRFATMFGPGRSANHQSRLRHGELIECAISDLPFVEPFGGDLDDLVYVEDAAEALVDAAIHASPLQGAYNIGTGKVHSLADLARASAEVFPTFRCQVGNSQRDAGYASRFDISRARTDIGFSPTSSLVTNVERYVAAMRSGVR